MYFELAINIASKVIGSLAKVIRECVFAVSIFMVAACSEGSSVEAEEVNSDLELKRMALIEYFSSIQGSEKASSSDGVEGIQLFQQFLAGEKADVQKAIALLQNASNHNDAAAMALLGYAYLKGKGVDVDWQKAKELLQKADKLGSASGAYHLGQLYYSEEGIFGDLREAVKLTVKAKERGYLTANSFLGELEVAKGNIESAVAIFNEGVDNQDLYSLTALGNMYVDGEVVRRNTKRGLQLLETAWEKGWHDAGISLYGIYIEGRGVERNYDTGLRYLKQAAYLGSGDAYGYLCSLTQKGDFGLDQDFDKGVSYCEKGIELGSSIAMEVLATTYFIERKDKSKYAYAKKLVFDAAARGNPISMARIGTYIINSPKNGYGFERDLDLAYQYFKSSAELGWPIGMLMLSSLSLDQPKPKFDIPSLSKPDYKSCWYWASVLEAISPGDNSKALVAYCDKRLPYSGKQNSEKARINKWAEYYLSNSWTQEYLYAIQRGVDNLNMSPTDRAE